MRRMKKQKAKFEFIEEETAHLEGGTSKADSIRISSDDEESKEDLTPKIVEEKFQLSLSANPRGGGRVTDFVSSSSEEVEVVAGPSWETSVAATAGGDGYSVGTVIGRKKKKKAKQDESGESAVSLEAEKEIMERVEASDKVDILETNTVEITDNLVLRKLLRGPRYFDPPDIGWGTCYNCGEEGHATVNCTSAKRKKPCFVCGSLEHNAKHCSKAQDCFICKSSGHRAKDCPEKRKGGSQSLKICLKCGNTGHDMLSCKSDYSADDLKEIQCYICKKFGHFCCINSVSRTSGEISCYKCGQLGHTGLACSSLLYGETAGAGMPSSCYRCGEVGHFARECTNSAKASSRLIGGSIGAISPSLCYKCGEAGHFSRECASAVKASSRLVGESIGAISPSFCYKCGEAGHFSRECPRAVKASSELLGETIGSISPSLCYKCGEGGHFARECTSSAKTWKRICEFSKPKTLILKSHKEKDYKGLGSMLHEDYKRHRTEPHKGTKGYRSVTHENGKAHNKGKAYVEERVIKTPKKSKHRGGWLTEDPREFSTMSSRENGWWSSGRPSTKRAKVSSFQSGNHSLNAQFPKKLQNSYSGTSNSQGSGKAFQHGYSVSRFDNFSANRARRNYDWW